MLFYNTLELSIAALLILIYLIFGLTVYSQVRAAGTSAEASRSGGSSNRNKEKQVLYLN
jgi:hypothetical protein